MKPFNFLPVILLCFFVQNAYSQSHWTFYSNSHHKGYQKAYDAGEQKAAHQWKWNSWKSNCCVRLYYYTRHGKVGEKTLCGDVRDFKSELKKWEDLKYGYQSGWKNIERVKMYCDDHQYAAKNNSTQRNQNTNNGNQNYNRNTNQNNYNRNTNRNQNNYTRNDNNNHDQPNNNYDTKNDYAKKPWYKHYGKGNVIFASDYHYGGQYRAQASGSHDYRSLKFYPKSIILSKSGRYVVVEYRDNYNRRKSFVLREDVPDLRKYMTSNLKLGSEYRNEPYKAITKIVIMRN